eukprot:6213123-Pleurochrysis_carterae.AAC.2
MKQACTNLTNGTISGTASSVMLSGHFVRESHAGCVSCLSAHRRTAEPATVMIANHKCDFILRLPLAMNSRTRFSLFQCWQMQMQSGKKGKVKTEDSKDAADDRKFPQMLGARVGQCLGAID